MPKHKSAGLLAQLAIAERLYVEEPISLTLDDIAQQTGININNLKDASSSNNWIGKRQRFQEEVQKTYLALRVPEKTDASHDIAERAERVLSLFIDKLEEELPDLKFRNAEEALKAFTQAMRTQQELKLFLTPQGGSSLQREVRVSQTHILRQLTHVESIKAEERIRDATDS